MLFKKLTWFMLGMVKDISQNALNGYRAVLPEDKGSVTQKSSTLGKA
jgi:hypothetical protein